MDDRERDLDARTLLVGQLLAGLVTLAPEKLPAFLDPQDVDRAQLERLDARLFARVAVQLAEALGELNDRPGAAAPVRPVGEDRLSGTAPAPRERDGSRDAAPGGRIDPPRGSA